MYNLVLQIYAFSNQRMNVAKQLLWNVVLVERAYYDFLFSWSERIFSQSRNRYFSINYSLITYNLKESYRFSSVFNLRMIHEKNILLVVRRINTMRLCGFAVKQTQSLIEKVKRKKSVLLTKGNKFWHSCVMRTKQLLICVLWFILYGNVT